MIIISMKRIKLLTIISLLLIFSSTHGLAFAEEMSTATMVDLRGKLAIKKFVDANGKVETEYILTIEPIDVSKDEFGGPAKHVTEIQLVLPGKIKGRKYINKKINVKGHLFYPISAHHHTKVLIEIKSIALLKDQ